MSFESALRISEILLALAFLQQSSEHLFGISHARLWFVPRAVLALFLLAGVSSPWVLLGLTLHSFMILLRFDGPYNGGSDRMGLLVLYCLTLAHWLPEGPLAQAALGYLGVQVVLSYFISGQVKIVNPHWRSGCALREVFSFSAYPVTEKLRSLSQRRNLLWGASWGVMLFEVLFPLGLLHPILLILALCIAFVFHLANACLFGLNRFVWVWLASYPSLLWLQARLISG